MPWAAGVTELPGAEIFERYLKRRVPQRRMMEAGEIANGALFLSLPESRGVTGPGAQHRGRLRDVVTVLPMVHPEASQMSTVLYEQTGKIVTLTINVVVPAAELMPTARNWAEAICERGPLAARAAKEAIRRGLSMSLPDGLRLEAFLSGTLRGTEGAGEGPKAFVEKRKLNFQAR